MKLFAQSIFDCIPDGGLLSAVKGICQSSGCSVMVGICFIFAYWFTFVMVVIEIEFIWDHNLMYAIKRVILQCRPIKLLSRDRCSAVTQCRMNL